MLLEKAPRVDHSIVSEIVAENDLAPNIVSIFTLGWSNNSLTEDLTFYDDCLGQKPWCQILRTRYTQNREN